LIERSIQRKVENMQMISVASSNLSAVGYDPVGSALVVRFRNNTTYKYLNVPEHVFNALMSASSKGAFLNDNIREQFEFVRLE
jgi:hypothetical protein